MKAWRMNGFLAAAAAVAALASSPAQAADVGSMFANFQSSIAPLMALCQRVAWLGAVGLFIGGLLRLVQVEQGRAEFKSALFMMVAAVGMWSLVPAINTIAGTLGASGLGGMTVSPLAQTSAGGATSMAPAIKGVFAFVKLVGLIAFIRGLLLLKAYGDNKDGALGRALTHLFGGAAALNLEWTVTLLANSVGATSALTFLGLG